MLGPLCLLTVWSGSLVFPLSVHLFLFIVPWICLPPRLFDSLPLGPDVRVQNLLDSRSVSLVVSALHPRLNSSLPRHLTLLTMHKATILVSLKTNKDLRCTTSSLWINKNKIHHHSCLNPPPQYILEIDSYRKLNLKPQHAAQHVSPGKAQPCPITTMIYFICYETSNEPISVQFPFPFKILPHLHLGVLIFSWCSRAFHTELGLFR